MRTLSLTMREALNTEHSGEVPVFLLRITHALLEEPILISTDPTERLEESPLTYGTRSRGQSYIFLPMNFALPDETDGGVPAMRLTIDNVGRELINLLRSTSTPALVAMELVLASAPDAVEIAMPQFELVSADYDAEQVTLTLALNGLATEPFPYGSFSPATFPGLF
ncbi:DUF1833 family protein [Bosea sp. FBZP-16]|uniref:DUF1833 family protein n=1 Tax=Bosea sp. FBZP-16 TaxID=2065382 RepID=UPI000C300F08|nr:DUF1833 family protein [Bosea sp. FBZP-16]